MVGAVGVERMVEGCEVVKGGMIESERLESQRFSHAGMLNRRWRGKDMRTWVVRNGGMMLKKWVGSEIEKMKEKNRTGRELFL